MASIKNVEDLRQAQLQMYDELGAGKIDARLAHAKSGCLSRVLYACNAEVRYRRARDEHPVIGFMHYGTPAKAASKKPAKP